MHFPRRADLEFIEGPSQGGAPVALSGRRIAEILWAGRVENGLAWAGGWQWSRDCDEDAKDRIGLHVQPDRVVLRYRVSVADGPWEEVVETVPIERVDCGFGGSRAYFRCPGVVDGVACGRRVMKLYMRGRYFLCRACHRLAYPSQSEGVPDRAMRRADKIRVRLGGDPGAVRSFPPRPKNMWRRTYARLCEGRLQPKTSPCAP